jgi:L-serine dehydratase
MTISVFELFKIGIGPSSSHTVGPMRAALQFAQKLQAEALLTQVQTVKVELFGSLGATGKGHGTDKAVLLGLEGEIPEQIDPSSIDEKLDRIRTHATLLLLGQQPIAFRESEHLLFYWQPLPFHPNGMQFSAFDAADRSLLSEIYYSIGGGFVVCEIEMNQPKTSLGSYESAVPYPFGSATQLLALCDHKGLTISQVMSENEKAWRSAAQVRQQLLQIWQVMQACVQRGCQTEGILPGGLNIKRRAPTLYRQLSSQSAATDPLQTLDWVSLFAIAVNEENAAGGRVVTAPTNGAAGVVPAVLHYYDRFCPQATADGIVQFLLTAGAIGILYKENASISGADVGCQGEVGVASSMAAGALTEVLGGTIRQVENAAEIAMEHHLGLTCDPIAGLVQIPCIERNAMGAIKAINAARMALRGDGQHFVSLDQVIKTMYTTGADMLSKYKETATGGLAVNVIEC